MPEIQISDSLQHCSWRRRRFRNHRNSNVGSTESLSGGSGYSGIMFWDTAGGKRLLDSPNPNATASRAARMIYAGVPYRVLRIL